MVKLKFVCVLVTLIAVSFNPFVFADGSWPSPGYLYVSPWKGTVVAGSFLLGNLTVTLKGTSEAGVLESVQFNVDWVRWLDSRLTLVPDKETMIHIIVFPSNGTYSAQYLVGTTFVVSVPYMVKTFQNHILVIVLKNISEECVYNWTCVSSSWFNLDFRWVLMVVAGCLLVTVILIEGVRRYGQKKRNR